MSSICFNYFVFLNKERLIGFIGSNFLNYIHDKWPQAKFVNVDKLILNSDANYVDESVRNSPRYSLVLADIGNGAVLEKVLRENNVIF